MWLNRNINIFDKNELIEDDLITWNGTSGRLIFTKEIFNKFNGYSELFENLSMEELFLY